MGTFLSVRHLTFRAKLVGAFASLVGIVYLNAAVVWWAGGHVATGFREIREDNLQATETVAEFRENCGRLVRIAQAYLITGRSDLVREFERAAEAAEKNLEGYSRVIARAPLPEASEMVAEMTETRETLRRHHAHLTRAGRAVFRLPAGVALAAERNDESARLTRVYERAMPAIAEALERERGELAEHTDAVSRAIDRMRVGDFFACAAGALIAMLIGIPLYRSIRRPVAELTETVSAIAAGERDTRARIFANDEIGQLAAAFNAMADEILVGKAVRRERDYLEAIMFAMQDSVVVSGADGAILNANPVTCRLLGYSAEELTGMRARMLLADATLSTPEGRLVLSGRAMSDARVALRAKNGEVIATSMSCSPLSATADPYAGAVWVGRDMRHTLELISELEEARDRALDAVKAKSEFLATMSHEIRTPLNGIFGMTELAMDTQDDAERREFLERARSCSQGLLTLLTDVLDFSRMDAGELQLEQVDFDLRVVVGGILDTLAVDAERKSIELIGVVDPSLPAALRGDPNRLRQIVLNLAANAVKFTKHGEVVIQFDANGEVSATEPIAIRCTVRDSGIGIPPETQCQIFEAFKQGDGSTTREYGGVGLGLAISQRLVRAMGGLIEVESEPGRGSTFSFAIKLPAGTAVKQTTDRNSDISGVRVLVVDDNVTNRAVLLKLLQAWGCRAALASGGMEACDLLAHGERSGEPFDLILLDMQMPQMDGVATARRMASDPATRHVPIIALTSLSRGTAGSSIGPFAAFLAKPVKQAELRATIAAAVRQRRDSRAARRRDSAETASS